MSIQIIPNLQKISVEFDHGEETIILPVVGWITEEDPEDKRNTTMAPLVFSPEDGEAVSIFRLLSIEPYNKVDGQSVKFKL